MPQSVDDCAQPGGQYATAPSVAADAVPTGGLSPERGCWLGARRGDWKACRLECLVCDRHSGAVDVPGGSIYEDELVFVGHAGLVTEEADEVYLGWMLVEPKRHLNGLADLRPDEAERIGLLQSVVARALVDAQGAEHVYSFVFGHHVPHLHVHLLPRYPGTPREYWGTRIDEGPDAPTGSQEEIARLVDRLRTLTKDGL